MKKWKLIIPALLSLLLVACSAPKEPEYIKDEYFLRFPETREAYVKSCELVAAVTVQETGIRNMVVFEGEQSEQENVYESHVNIHEVFYGNSRPGDEILILQEGDNRERVYDSVMKAVGYLKKGTSYLLFMDQRLDDATGETYYVPKLAGQFELDKQGNFVVRSQESGRYWEDVTSVSEMRDLFTVLAIE